LEEEKDYEFKACPKCKKDIPIPYEEEEKIIIRCPYCGAAGKVKNPYI
jgi:DNA-directed RNA polymerase subunit RPC12/RpoP